MSAHVRRSPAVVQVRCAGAGHLLLTVRHLHGTEFEVIRAPGRAGGHAGDQDSWQRTGAGTNGVFATLPELRRPVCGREAGTVDGLLGESPWLFCRCGSVRLDEATADAIGETLDMWHASGQNTTRPTTLTVVV